MSADNGCGCDRSPTGKCVVWHKLSDEQYREKLAAYEAKQAAKKAVLRGNVKPGIANA